MRHSEPQRLEHDKLGLIGFGRDLAPLTPQGINIAKNAAQNPILDGAQLIVSSPITRALQTAGIIAKHKQLSIEVELGLVERRFDLTQKLSAREIESLFDEYINERGVWSSDKEHNWENIEMQHKRLKDALDKYLDYDKIIVVAHGEIGRRLKMGKLDFCEMFEIEYGKEFEFLGWS